MSLTPESVMMVCDTIERIGNLILWMFLVIAKISAIILFFSLFVKLAITSTIRDIWRRFAEGKL